MWKKTAVKLELFLLEIQYSAATQGDASGLQFLLGRTLGHRKPPSFARKRAIGS